MQNFTNTFKTIAILLVFSLLTVIYTPAYAAGVDDAGAQRLGRLFTGLLKKQEDRITGNKGVFTMAGNVSVKPANGYYAVTIPPLTTLTANQVTENIGAMSINVVPTNDPNSWKMSIFVPSPITYTDPTGRTLMQLDIGKQRTGGLWDSKLQGFSKLSGQYSDLKFTSNITQRTYNVGQMNVKSDLTRTPTNNWSGPSEISLSNISASAADQGNIFSLAKADINLTLSELNVENEEKDEATKKLAAANGTDSLSIILLKDRYDEADLSIAFNDMKVALLEQSAPGHVQIKSGGLHFKKDKKDDGKSDRIIQINYDGLTSENNQHRYRDLLPEKLRTLITLKSFPLNRILASLSGVYAQDFKHSGEEKIALLRTIMTFPTYFTESGTNITITDTNFNNSLYSVIVAGKIETSLSSILGLTGDISFKSKGLKNIETSLEKRIENLPAAEQMKLKRGLASIKFLNETGVSEGEYKNITVSLDNAAQVLVNGKDLDAVIANFTNLKVAAEETEEAIEEVTTPAEAP